MNNIFGIYAKSYDLLIAAIQDFPEIEKAVIFGSRALGNYKKGSDVDLAIFGEAINHRTTVRLSAKLNEELPIPYFFDVVNFNTIDNVNLKEHILEKGKIIFEKKSFQESVLK